MAAVTIIRKDNTKAKKVIADVRARKAALRDFLAKGGRIEDFNPKKKVFA